MDPSPDPDQNEQITKKVMKRINIYIAEKPTKKYVCKQYLLLSCSLLDRKPWLLLGLIRLCLNPENVIAFF